MKVVLLLEGHLTQEKLVEALSAVKVGEERLSLIVDCSNMTSYDMEARKHFVSWNRENASRIDRVAVVTKRVLWHMIVSAMGFASSQDMRPFNDKESAERWLASTF